jgi:hypothetical protein
VRGKGEGGGRSRVKAVAKKSEHMLDENSLHRKFVCRKKKNLFLKFVSKKIAFCKRIEKCFNYHCDVNSCPILDSRIIFICFKIKCHEYKINNLITSHGQLQFLFDTLCLEQDDLAFFQGSP